MSINNGKICTKCGCWDTICFCPEVPVKTWTSNNTIPIQQTEFYKYLESQQVELPADVSKLINDNFWELLA